ncbi:hypothetical protein CBR_g412 [Chara braunii]|uniref:Reverse transcriptase n=1 Tax=Chara braunii TaxID=69332 RepID=A0A388JQM3_CHABU|nr:hypothetical protein CBR_g412 [Chara braunii]|eukprot:GBG60081.1 hypothetical protein CBR_g412 [Chara braunii]
MDAAEYCLYAGGTDGRIYVTPLNGGIPTFNRNSSPNMSGYVQLIGHCQAVTSLVFSLDGVTLVSGSEDSTVKIWDTISRQVLRTFNHGKRCKLTLPHEEVLVAASYLEGSAARWLSGLVQLQGYGHDFRSWAASQKMEDFLKMVEERWHDPQEAQKATDAILTLHTRQFKSVREATDAVERLICVLGVRYEPQVLLTSYLRTLSQPLRNQLAKEANINMHNFPSFRKVALDLEAKIGHGQSPTTDERKKTLPPNWKAKGRIMFVDNDGSTIELDGNIQEGVGAEAGGKTSEGGVVAAVTQQKGKGTGRRPRGSRSKSQTDPNAPPWEKAGLSEDVWRDRWARQACIKCGQYGHSMYKCRNRKVTEKIPPTMGSACMVVHDYLKDIECLFPYAEGEQRHHVSFLVSDELPMDMLLGMYYLSVAQPQFDWDRKLVKHTLPNGGTARLHKFKASSLIDSHGCLCAAAFYNYYKQNPEEGMYLVYVSAAGEPVKMPPEIEGVVAKYPDLFEELTGIVEREVVHAIEIIPGSSIPKGRTYRMSPGELDELRRQLKELIEKGWIRPSVSPYGSPVLFVPKKKEGTLRMCIDYRGLNAITVKNREPLPRIDDLLDRVQGCRYFSKIDLKSGYHQIAIRPEDQHKTAFQTRYGLYEFVVMPFGLCNAPGTFQHAMNRIFHDYLDKFVVVYLDDTLIFSKTVEEHVAHLDKVLNLLRQHKFKINGEKCEFGRTRILYLGHEISAEGLKPDDAKVASIRDWPRPQSVTEMRSFLGMTGYYRTFVKNYSIVAAPLTDLTRLDTPWEWTDECEAAFRHLKHALTHYEILKLPDPDKPFIVTTDASQYGIGAMLAQQEGPKLRPVEYMSKKMPSQKLAKSTYEKELYAVYKALTHWRHYLLGRFFILRTDHQTLKWMRTQPVLSDALKRWIEVIEQYDFGPQYLKGEYNKVADALSRRPDFSANDQAEQMNHAVQHLLRHYIKPNQVDWDEKLALVAILYNNAVHSATGKMPEAVEHMQKAQAAMIESENKHRRPSTFQVGDRVWVKSSELGQEFGISRKLMYFGPWEVLDVVGTDPDGPSYVIRIPGHLRTYPVFHASKLAASKETDKFPSRRSMLPPTMDGEVDIDDIVDHREMPVQKPPGRGRPPKPKLQFRVHFRHHTDPKEDRWFTREELMQTAPQIVARYEKDVLKVKRQMAQD